MPRGRLLPFDPITVVMGSLLIAGIYALLLFLLWLAFHESGPPGG